MTSVLDSQAFHMFQKLVVDHLSGPTIDPPDENDTAVYESLAKHAFAAVKAFDRVLDETE